MSVANTYGKQKTRTRPKGAQTTYPRQARDPGKKRGTDGGRATLGGVSAEGNHPRTTGKAETRPTRTPQGREPPTTHGHRPGTATRRTITECFFFTLAVLVHTIIRPRDNSKKGKSHTPAAQVTTRKKRRPMQGTRQPTRQEQTKGAAGTTKVETPRRPPAQPPPLKAPTRRPTPQETPPTPNGEKRAGHPPPRVVFLPPAAAPEPLKERHPARVRRPPLQIHAHCRSYHDTVKRGMAGKFLPNLPP